MAFKMKNPSLLKIVSALKKRTNPMVPETTGEIGALPGDVETSYEKAKRGLGQIGSIVDVLRRRGTILGEDSKKIKSGN
tara:strand:+ start:5993 stop:6229 length:237 start_codon:yes stop_codon:yes gene_type:complete